MPTGATLEPVSDMMKLVIFFSGAIEPARAVGIAGEPGGQRRAHIAAPGLHCSPGPQVHPVSIVPALV